MIAINPIWQVQKQPMDLHRTKEFDLVSAERGIGRNSLPYLPFPAAKIMTEGKNCFVLIMKAEHPMIWEPRFPSQRLG
jgi:hypothetical protein